MREATYRYTEVTQPCALRRPRGSRRVGSPAPPQVSATGAPPPARLLPHSGSRTPAAASARSVAKRSRGGTMRKAEPTSRRNSAHPALRRNYMSHEALGGRSFLPERVSLKWGRSPERIVGERLFLSVWPQPSGKPCWRHTLFHPPLISLCPGHPGSGTLRPQSSSRLLCDVSLIRMRGNGVTERRPPERAGGWCDGGANSSWAQSVKEREAWGRGIGGRPRAYCSESVGWVE